MMTPLTVDVARPLRAARLILAGDLDYAGALELETMFRGLGALHGKSSVVIDVRALEFCDSAGWHALERCRDEGATLLGNPPCLRRLFYLIRNAHKLPAALHELRGLQPGAAQRLPEQIREAA